MTALPLQQQRFIAAAALLLVAALLLRAAAQGTVTTVTCPNGNNCVDAKWQCEGPVGPVFTARCTGMDAFCCALLPPSFVSAAFPLPFSPMSTSADPDSEFSDAAKCVDSYLASCGATALTMRLELSSPNTSRS